MKVGDLVKYQANIKGLEGLVEGLVGIIIGWNGVGAVVLWTRSRRPQTELVKFIEVIECLDK